MGILQQKVMEALKMRMDGLLQSGELGERAGGRASQPLRSTVNYETRRIHNFMR
jgi:hypothetical protein